MAPRRMRRKMTRTLSSCDGSVKPRAAGVTLRVACLGEWMCRRCPRRLRTSGRSSTACNSSKCRRYAAILPPPFAPPFSSQVERGVERRNTRAWAERGACGRAGPIGAADAHHTAGGTSVGRRVDTPLSAGRVGWGGSNHPGGTWTPRSTSSPQSGTGPIWTRWRPSQTSIECKISSVVISFGSLS